MSTIPLLGPTPISVGGGTLNPDVNACFTCTPPYEHLREWKPDPDNPDRQRTLVLCFDGTGDSFDQDNSNVVQFLAMLKKDDPTKQLVYYQAGIGTYTSNVLKTPIVENVSKLLDEMIAWNLAEHIKDGYLFLMQNYRVGDQICIFGFSRGAFTARALAGMLQKVGLLPPCNLEQLPFAYAMYARDDEDGLKLSMQFKRTFSVDVRIKFLGVWDTVQSVGLIPKHLPFSGSNNAILYFRHALALDERRVKFFPSFCTGGKPKQERTDTQVSEHSKATSDSSHHKIERRQRSGKSYEYELHVNAMTGPETNVEEVFFAGAHCDVGGGSVVNGQRHSLARIPLRWMIRECFKVNSGIVFDAHMLKHEVGLDVDSIFKAPNPLPPATLHLAGPDSTELEGFSLRHIPVVIISGLGSPFRWIWGKLSHLRLRRSPQVIFSLEQSRFVSEGEAQEELNDALSPIYDQLEKHTYWKVMEWIPCKLPLSPDPCASAAMSSYGA
ncbi:hypothetical protein BDM02DRAFT_3101283 [Thelephora ganbajun]|uniref:Uncharacterized protein n=1 Tax=Thelephora ganbajun TaxID=370292 RepID=A0ACB6Z7S6_THEGA|nr:hypothetical protein BDM02DRAFT_3101283 [Thelephora ganbajun]